MKNMILKTGLAALMLLLPLATAQASSPLHQPEFPAHQGSSAAHPTVEANLDDGAGQWLEVSRQSQSPRKGPLFGLKLKEVKLYSVPARPQCGKPVKMIAEFYTNKPGKIDFFYIRGDGEKQKASVKTVSGAKGIMKSWSKTYKFNATENRKYRIHVKDHKTATKWVALKVNCSTGGTGLKN
ncbi:hypothetical protein [Denitrobaculum tricleocarpae]|uniref:Uncharacterized protein n=1 Tax=Denitrobaculum tricleocarpae TaxID=2591009 RepID=A0A545U313_9PROT|nr:hypothetical protein [Denitrobaculum tricleocarpae]TQV83814.1 hypothetical protein FKG95_04335 [Denitrobaculum tricleocarpae]